MALRESFLETKNDAEKGFMVFAILMNIFTEELKQKAEKMLGPFIGAFERLKPTVMNTLEGIGSFLSGIFSGFMTYFPEISAGIQDLIEMFKELLDAAFGTEEMKDMWGGIGTILGKIVGLMVTLAIETMKLVRGPLILLKGIFQFVAKILQGDFIGAFAAIGDAIFEFVISPLKWAMNAGKAVGKFLGFKTSDPNSDAVQKNTAFGKAVTSGDTEMLGYLKKSESEGKLDEQINMSKEQFAAKEREEKQRHKELLKTFDKSANRPLFDMSVGTQQSTGGITDELFGRGRSGGGGGRGPTVVQQNITIQGAVNDNALRNLRQVTGDAVQAGG
jgi:hypothetical protein